MKKLLITISLFIIILLAGLFWWNEGTSPINPSSKETVIFVVSKGVGLKEIANKLEAAKLIRNRVIFFLNARFARLEDKIQAGTFRLSQSMTAQEIAQNLTHGTLDIWVTIPEGKRGTEIAEILKEKIPTYDFSWPLTLTANEGYLFPDTYLIPTNADINQIINIMRNNFEQKYKSLNTSKTKLSKNEVVTLASIIEREARTEKDRPIVAGILLNRLEHGMRLELCSTVQYALGYYPLQKTWWKNGLTFEDLKIASPYNTYRNDGIPPAPIANPGIAALAAVINPTESNYLYWLSDATGQIHYSKTLREHNQNIEKYGLN
jgi:UPF0755 protein